MSSVDVLIVGAGVAGATAAIGLARQGLDVLLVDRSKLPRHKVCGCCLNSEAVAMLHDLGLGSKLKQAGAQSIDRVTARCNGRSISLPSRGGVSLSRYVLDALMLDTAKRAGCVVRDETTARIGTTPDRGEGVGVDCAGPGTRGYTKINAKIVLVADGLAGSCTAGIKEAKRTHHPNSLRGYGAHMPAGQHDLQAGEVIMRCGAGGYVGTVVLEDGALDIAAAMKPGWVKACRGPVEAASRLCKEAGQGLDGLDALAWRGTAPLTGGRARLWSQRVFFLGDAAGYVEPFTGEGMVWAMRSARTATPFAIQAVRGWDERIGLAWECAYRKEVQSKQWRCKLFATLLKHPGVVSSCIATVNRLPGPLKRTTARFAMPPMFRSVNPTQPAKLAPV